MSSETKKKNYVVYRIKNNVNGRVYFGSTNSFSNRKSQHLQVMRGSGNGLPNYLRDIKKYKLSDKDFSFRILARFDNQYDMLIREQAYLLMYWGTKNCYNERHEVVDGWVRKTFVAWNMETTCE